MVGGTAQTLLDERFTTAPPAGATPLIVTVPIATTPLVTELGLMTSPVGTGGNTVRVAVTELLPIVAVMSAAVDFATFTVEIVKVAAEAPLETVTVDGAIALKSLDERLTTVPPGGAAPLRVMVPVLVSPPITEVGASVKVAGPGGVIVNVPVADVPPNDPVIVTRVDDATTVVLTTKEAVEAPPATVTVTGGLALALFEPSPTTVPPAGAGPESVTVPVVDLPPITETGENVIPVGSGGLIVSGVVVVTVP